MFDMADVRVLPFTVIIVWLAYIMGSRSCLRRCGELVSSAMEEQWFERWPVVVAATRVAIETATRQLAAVVSEMQQQNGELRQRTSHLEHELALTEESLFLATSNTSDAQQQQCDRKSLCESGAGGSDMEWHAHVGGAGARTFFDCLLPSKYSGYFKQASLFNRHHR